MAYHAPTFKTCELKRDSVARFSTQICCRKKKVAIRFATKLRCTRCAFYLPNSSAAPMLLLMILFGEIGFFFKSNLFSCLFCSWWYGIQCFFHGAGCNSTSGIRGTMFILMYVVSYVGGANLLRHAEGATWLAIVTVKRLTLN